MYAFGMKAAVYKKTYVPSTIHFVEQTNSDTDQQSQDIHAYLWLLQGPYPFTNHGVSLRDLAVSEPLYRRKNEEEFLESLHNVSRTVAFHLLELFSDMYDTASENDVVQAAEAIVHKGVDAPIEDHLLVTHVAKQLRQLPQFA